MLTRIIATFALIVSTILTSVILSSPASGVGTKRCDHAGVPVLWVQAWSHGKSPVVVTGGVAWTDGSWKGINYAVFQASVRTLGGELVKRLITRTVNSPSKTNKPEASWPVRPVVKVPTKKKKKARWRVDVKYVMNNGSIKKDACNTTVPN